MTKNGIVADPKSTVKNSLLSLMVIIVALLLTRNQIQKPESTDSPSNETATATAQETKTQAVETISDPIRPFTQETRYPNAVRAARKQTQDSRRVTVAGSQNETFDLTETLLRIAEREKDSLDHDGTEFRNRERRLPKTAAGYYSEFVHHKNPNDGSPGPCRIIIGQEGDIWFTADHYETFLPVNDVAGQRK